MAQREGEVVIMDADRRVRIALRTLISASGLVVAAEAESPDEARRVVSQRRPGLAVVDPAQPDPARGCALIRWLVREREVRVVALIADPRLRAAAAMAGASVVLTKDCAPEDLLKALGRAAAATT